MPESDRLPTETESQYLAYCCYRDLGTGRTSRAAWEKYQEAKKRKKAQKSAVNKRVGGNFSEWKELNNWDSRVVAWDAIRQAEQQEIFNQSLGERMVEVVSEAHEKGIRFSNANMDGCIKIIELIGVDVSRIHLETMATGQMSFENRRALLDLDKVARGKAAEFSVSMEIIGHVYGLTEVLKLIDSKEQSA